MVRLAHSNDNLKLSNNLLLCVRFKVFADFEAYTRCQQGVSELYKVKLRPQPLFGFTSDDPHSQRVYDQYKR